VQLGFLSGLLPSTPILLACCLIVAVAAFVQVSVGMGFGTLAAPLIATLDPNLVPVSIMFMGMVVSFIGAWRERSNISGQDVGYGVLGRLIGMACAIAVLLVLPDRNSFALLFGVLVLVGIALTASGLKIPFTNKNLLGLSIVSGLMGTITSVGAPPMALLFHGRPPEIVRPTLCAFFGLGCLISLIGLGIFGWVRMSDLALAVVMLPAMFAGIHLSRYFRITRNEKLGVFLLSIAALAALSLIYRGLVS